MDSWLFCQFAILLDSYFKGIGADFEGQPTA